MSEALLLVPGMMSDARIFTPQINVLSSSFAVQVTPPTRGETIREMAGIILDTAPQQFALAGHDMGGIVAMEILRRAPERVTRIALISTSPLAETPPQAAWREPLIVKASTGQLDAAMEAALGLENFAPGPDRARVFAEVMQMARELGSELFVRQNRALQRRPDAQKVLRQTRVPALVICGAHDRIMPVKRHETMADLIPFAEIAVIEDAGHVPSLETPLHVTHYLRDWMCKPLILQ